MIGYVSGNSIVIAKANSSKSIPTLPFSNSRFQHKIRGNQTDHSFVLFEAEYFNEGPGHHFHMKDDELFHILEGKVQLIVDSYQFCAATMVIMFMFHGIFHKLFEFIIQQIV